jgi:hypothetical protein
VYGFGDLPEPQSRSKPDPSRSTFAPPLSENLNVSNPYRTPSFTTPRKPIDIDFSSGPENSSPPEQFEADTEETPEVTKTADVMEKEEKETRNKRRNSLFNFYGRFAPSPDLRQSKHNQALARRIHKKRRRAQNLESQVSKIRRMSDDSDVDVHRRPPVYNNNMPPPKLGPLASFFSFIEAYPDVPALLTKYLQTIFTAGILSGAFYLLYSIWAAIRSDVDRASEETIAEVLAEMQHCTQSYVDNLCGSNTRAPALDSVCRNWEACMNRDPNAVKRAKISAHTFATIINSFVEPISWKTCKSAFHFGSFALSTVSRKSAWN